MSLSLPGLAARIKSTTVRLSGDRAGRRHGADRRVRTLSTWSQMVALICAQMAGVRSLRELVAAFSNHS